MNELIRKIHTGASRAYRTIVLPESHDERILAAAAHLTNQNMARVILIGKPLAIQMKADDLSLDISKASILNPAEAPFLDAIVQRVQNKKFARGMTPAELAEYIQQPIHFAAGLVGTGEADAMVAGADTATSEVVRSALRFVGVAAGSALVSSSFIMIPPDGESALTFSDCAVVPDPDSEQLTTIAADAQQLHRMLTGHAPRVAFLSFSTKGSADHPMVAKIRAAAQLFREKYPDVPCDGELQLDTALVPAVARKKAPDSEIAGTANVLVFPNLDAGNIGYKLVQRLAGYTALGPMLQGLARPVHDLSRGCSVDDVVNIAAVAALQSSSTE